MKIVNIWEGFQVSVASIGSLGIAIYILIEAYKATGYLAIGMFIAALLCLVLAGILFWYIGECINAYEQQEEGGKE